MRPLLLYTLILSLTALLQALDPTSDQIIELFSNGASSPITPIDPSWSEPGMLTPVGLRQHYILGRILYEKYETLIKSSYSSNQVSVFSNNIPRCIQSASAHIYGLYEEENPSLPSDYPPEQGVPAYKDPNAEKVAKSVANNKIFSHDPVIGTKPEVFKGDKDYYCPALFHLKDQGMKDQATQEAFQDIFKDTIINFNQFLDCRMKIKTPNDLIAYADAMLADISDNRSLIGGLRDPALITNITWAAMWFKYHFNLGQQIQRELSAVNIVDAFLNELFNFRQGKGYNIAAIFSGDENNILSLLSAFGIITEQCILENFYSTAKNGTMVYPSCSQVNFASNIVVEFYNTTNTPYIKLYYNNIPLSICNGKYECPYEEFVSFARNSVGNRTKESYSESCQALPSALINKEEPGPRTAITAEMLNFCPEVEDNSLAVQLSTNIALGLVSIALIVKIVWDKRRNGKILILAKEKNCFYEKQMANRSTIETFDSSLASTLRRTFNDDKLISLKQQRINLEVSSLKQDSMLFEGL